MQNHVLRRNRIASGDHIVILYKTPNDTGFKPAKILNYSKRGMKILTPTKLFKDTVIEINTDHATQTACVPIFAENSDPKNSQGNVKWSSHENGCKVFPYSAGIEFGDELNFAQNKKIVQYKHYETDEIEPQSADQTTHPVGDIQDIDVKNPRNDHLTYMTHLVLAAVILALFATYINLDPNSASKASRFFLSFIPSAVVVCASALLAYIVLYMRGLTWGQNIQDLIKTLNSNIKVANTDIRTSITKINTSNENIRKSNHNINLLNKNIENINNHIRNHCEKPHCSTIIKQEGTMQSLDLVTPNTPYLKPFEGTWAYDLHDSQKNLNVYGKFSIKSDNGMIEIKGAAWYYNTDAIRGTWVALGTFLDGLIIYIVYRMSINKPIDDEKPGDYTGILKLHTVDDDNETLQGKFYKLEDLGRVFGDVEALRAKKADDNSLDPMDIPKYFTKTSGKKEAQKQQT